MVQSQRVLLTGLFALGALVVAHLLDQAQFGRANVVMVYMLAVVVVADLLGLIPAVIVSLLGLPLFQVFDTPPYFDLNRRELAHTFPFAVMLLTALTVSNLAGRLREKVQESDQRSARSAALYALAAELSADLDPDSILEVTVRHVARAFRKEIDSAAVRARGLGAIAHIAGLAPDDEHLQAMLSLARQAQARAELRRRLQDTELRAKQESLRSSILGAVSHDLRTPLTTIIGASSSLLAESEGYTPDARRRLSQAIYDDAVQMQRQVENLLDLARLRSGELQRGNAWQAIEEIVGGALALVRKSHGDHRFRVDVPTDLPLIRCDSVLVERVLVNLLENAVRFSPRGSTVTVAASVEDGSLRITVDDEGPGIPPALREKVFNAFFRAGEAGRSGLGLAICKGIIEAHGGEIGVGDAPGGGARLAVSLPLPADSPSPPEPERNE